MNTELIVVNNQDELLEVLKKKSDRIIIKGKYAKIIREIMKGQLSSNETMGMELGSAGILTPLMYAIDSIKEVIGDEENKYRKIVSKLKVYKVESVSENELILRLKQLDY